MCYDTCFIAPLENIKLHFPDLIFDELMYHNPFDSVHIVGHAFPNHPIVYKNRDDKHLHCTLMEWGIIPYYIKDEASFLKQRVTMLNARSERILNDTKSYWHTIRNRRCLIPLTGIYEHREIKGWKKKVPYFITIKNEPLFYLPALYSVAQLPDTNTGEVLKRFTYTLVTTKANIVMQHIHNNGNNAGRMPLFMPLSMAKQWLQEDLSIHNYQHLLNYQLPSKALAYTPVYTIRTTKERPDGKLKNECYAWEQLPELM